MSSVFSLGILQSHQIFLSFSLSAYSLLDQIPEMFFDTRETESMLSPVVEAGLAALVVRRYIFETI